MGRVGIREAPKSPSLRYVHLSLARRRSLRWEAFNNLIESLAQSPGVSEFNVVKPCLIVLLTSTTFSRTAGKHQQNLSIFAWRESFTALSLENRGEDLGVSLPPAGIRSTAF
jgi:hypothetical protein